MTEWFVEWFVETLLCLLVIILAVIVYQLEKTLMAFKDDALAKLSDQSTKIDALLASAPAPVDPATIVPVADQQEVLNGIDVNTAKVVAGTH